MLHPPAVCACIHKLPNLFTCLPLSACGRQQHFVGGLPLLSIDSNIADNTSVAIYRNTIIEPAISMVLYTPVKLLLSCIHLPP